MNQNTNNDIDPLAVRPPIVRGEPTDEDARACAAWHDEHRAELAKRYPTQFVSVTRDGVISVKESRELARQDVDRLQREHGQFWAYLSSPSDRESKTA